MKADYLSVDLTVTIVLLLQTKNQKCDKLIAPAYSMTYAGDDSNTDGTNGYDLINPIPPCPWKFEGHKKDKV